ncbi:beta-lactamase-like protein [Candidatus Koribacter versatilis Ellin345]|uniref:Beta-lactamase-like protein n=1 Tax=Koribacter versatilis (strain Ellin345) TaxID=204669 RepID=Q1IJR0_KORVE|nr:MBL fold metallo-hydrolase [Candidatus Koribacter versatilis]ABF42890.1 beta-lactamase-like protein [Candidatus Koribacter versatilis Ellin345]
MTYIQFLGAAGVVTGSKHLVNTAADESGTRGFQLLIDCGLFQGQKEWRERNWRDTPIPAREIDAVVLTHAHLDHTGWIPRLVKEGFTGPIYATSATVDLCGVILPDSGHLQEEDAAFHNKIKSSKHDPALPLYTMQEALDSLKLFKAVDFEKQTDVSPELSFRYVRAAHILGSSMVELTVKQNGSSKLVLFSGDIGRVRDTEVAPGKVVRSGPYEGESADIVVMESTYGNREHPKNDPRPEMAKLIRDTVGRGGSVVVPAFAVERTQKLVFMVKQMMENNEIPKVPVHCDSPMAIKAVEIFLKHEEEFTDETKRLIDQYGSPLTWPGFYFDTTQQESKKINNSNYPQIIISSSGMATGGRIQHHLAQRLPDPKNLVLFIGFQAPGTRGRQIKDGEKEVKIFGQIVPVRAQVATLEQFSDHADTSELLEWLHTFKKAPSQTWLVHGEPDAAQKLRDAMIKALHWNVNVAQWMQKAPV